MGFPAFALTSGCGQIFGQGLRLHLNPLLVQLFDGFLCVEAALLHPFQRRGKGENGLLHGHGAVSVQRDGGGLEPGELLSDYLQLNNFLFYINELKSIIIYDTPKKYP